MLLRLKSEWCLEKAFNLINNNITMQVIAKNILCLFELCKQQCGQEQMSPGPLLDLAFKMAIKLFIALHYLSVVVSHFLCKHVFSDKKYFTFLNRIIMGETSTLRKEVA